MHFGAAYYPEHWPEERWETDASLMQEAHLNVVRIGEFAWCRMEAQENAFTFDWMDRVIAKLNARGIRVLIGTPTAGPPVWLVNAQTAEQDCRQLYEDGVRWQFGGRSLCCVNHPRFKEKSVGIAGALGHHFANHPGVIGFQLDNEIGMYGVRCYCAHCEQQFRAFLKEKYGSIENLNHCLGTIFGGGEFTSFDQVALPKVRQDLHNPGLLLDSTRFFSKSLASYLSAQAEAIRRAGAHQPITHNVCHMFTEWNVHDMNALFADLDIVGCDLYPSQFSPNPPAATMGLLHTIARSYKNKPYWVLEQQSGSPMAAASDDVRRLRLWTWQSIAYGASLILYFRWRTCRFGGEQYWRGILDHDGDINARYAMVKSCGVEIDRLSGLLGNLTYKHNIAILLDPDALASLALNAPGGQFSYRTHAEQFFQAATFAGQGCDVIYPESDFQPYPIIIAPLLRLMDPALAEKLRSFVQAGGILIVSPLFATLDRNSVAPDRYPPHLLQDVIGVQRIEWSSLTTASAPPKERSGEASDAWKNINAIGEVPVEAVENGPMNGIYTCSVWCDHLSAPAARTLARFAEGSPASGLPALTHHQYGSGSAYYVAGIMNSRFYSDLMSSLAKRLRPIASRTDKEGKIEIIEAIAGSSQLYFVLNHDRHPHELSLSQQFQELISQTAASDTWTLTAYGVALFIVGEDA